MIDERPTIVDSVWTLAVTLPPDVDAVRFLAGTVAEEVPWLSDTHGASLPEAPNRGRVRVPFGLGYSTEEQEQLVLVAAKVVYYLRGGDQDAGTADSSPVEAADPA